MWNKPSSKKNTLLVLSSTYLPLKLEDGIRVAMKIKDYFKLQED